MKLKKALLAGAALAFAGAMPSQASIVDNPHFKVLGLVIVWGADSSGGAPIASDFVIDTGSGTTAATSGDSDLISTDVHTVLTGSLTPVAGSEAGAFSVTTLDAVLDGGGNPVLDGLGNPTFSSGVIDASSAFSAFSLNDDTDIAADGISSSFYVASNTAFAIDATASVVGTPVNFALADVGFDMTVTDDDSDDATSFGSRAQDPGGSFSSHDDLGDLAAGVNVFTGAQRTAASRGSIMQQSVRFDVEYMLGGSDGYDLSMGDGEIEADVTYTVFVP